MRRAERFERRPEAVPARQVDPRLGPGEGPRDGAQRVDRGRVAAGTRATAGRRPRTKAQVGQLGDRRDVAEEAGEPRVVVDERSIGRSRGVGQLLQQGRALDEGPGCSRVVLRRRGDEGGARQLLQMAPGDRRVRVVRGDDLALLGELEAAIDRARRAAEDRAVRRAPAAADGAAAAVEERQLDAPVARDLDQRLLGAMQHPGRGQEPRFLVRVGIAEHHLLAVATRHEMPAIVGIGEEGVEDRACGGQRIGRLEQRDDIDARVRAVDPGQGRLGQPKDVGRVARGVGERHDEPSAGLLTEPFLDRGDRPERGEHLLQRHPWRDVHGGRGARGQCRQGRPVHLAVLADLERGEVEPERRELPAQLGDIAPGDPFQAVVDERRLDLNELGVQLGGIRVVPGTRAGIVGQGDARPAQSLGDEPEPLAVGLVREAAAQLPIGLG